MISTRRLSPIAENGGGFDSVVKISSRYIINRSILPHHYSGD